MYVVGYIEGAFPAMGQDETRCGGVPGGAGGEIRTGDKGDPSGGDSRTSQPRYADGYAVAYMPAIICEIDNGYLQTRDRV